MRIQWTFAAILAGVLTVSCGDRTAENPALLDENMPSAAMAPADEAVSPEIGPSPSDDSPAAPATQQRRATTGTRPVPTQPRAVTPSAAAASRDDARTSPPAASRPQVRTLTLPAGTALPLELTTALSSESAQVETPVRARLRQALQVDGHTVVPAGAVLIGSVIDVERAGRVQGRSRLAFRFTEVDIDGAREDLRTNPLTFEGEATRGEDATKVGAGAVGGAIVGGILGGGDGAAKGAAIGGAAGAGVVLATRGREVELAAGTNLAASLAQPMSVRVTVR